MLEIMLEFFVLFFADFTFGVAGFNYIKRCLVVVL
jgi:hypothetical protein